MTAYRWLAEPAVAEPGLAADLAIGFADQAEAEAWLAASHDDLRAAGAERVTLLAGDRLILGPMPLAPAAPPASTPI
ncbi:MAG: hypothetical protein LBH76_02380 [Propionibacteriaceae bacterium]|jgi:hypothetical protein|nr:hypothetical protein [Propionibacteriaceae bacterium]